MQERPRPQNYVCIEIAMKIVKCSHHSFLSASKLNAKVFITFTPTALSRLDIGKDKMLTAHTYLSPRYISLPNNLQVKGNNGTSKFSYSRFFFEGKF